MELESTLQRSSAELSGGQLSLAGGGGRSNPLTPRQIQPCANTASIHDSTAAAPSRPSGKVR